MRSLVFLIVLLACQSCKKELDCSCKTAGPNGQVIDEKNFTITRSDRKKGLNSCEEVYSELSGNGSINCVTN